jgi:hypothetical protein
MGTGGFKNLCASLFEIYVSNESNFNQIHLAGQCLSAGGSNSVSKLEVPVLGHIQLSLTMALP